MTTILPVSIQSIIVQYVIEYVEYTINEPMHLETLKWYDYMLKIPEELYFNLDKFYIRKLIPNLDIIDWLYDKYNFDRNVILIIFRDCCNRNYVEVAKGLRKKFDISKMDCLGFNGTTYRYCYHRKYYDMVNWFVSEFRLTPREISRYLEI
jgi:hypothetical protein